MGLRHDLRETERAHRDVLTTFRAALDRAFDPTSGTDGATKAALVGLPDRRGFLRIGGMTIAASALLVACGKDEPSATTAPTDPNVTDATLVLTAESIEQVAIATYQKAIDSGLIKTAAVVDVAKLFQQQHRDHAGLLAATATTMGQKVSGQPNAYLQSTVIDPLVKGLKDEAGVLALAFTLEQAAAQTYTFSAGVFSVPPLRQAIMTIGGIEARHLAVIAHIRGEDPVPLPYLKTDAAVPKQAYVASSGAVTPFPSTTTTTTVPGTTVGTTGR